jgi:outer membrane protein OmpA-like peptidoglycan-associated protein
MTVVPCRHLLLFLCIFITVTLSGCASRQSVIILLPEGDEVSGQVTVVNSQGSQLLNRSWQSVEIGGPLERPESPVVLDKAAVQDTFGGFISTMPLPPVHYRLNFKLGSVELLPASQLLLPLIAKAIKERHPAQLIVVGHTDTVESAEYNYQLGLQRARTVSERLASLGAAPISIEISSRGKTDLLVKTPDQTLEPRNRRAEVTIR